MYSDVLKSNGDTFFYYIKGGVRVAINLTEIYGKGFEPSQEYMRERLEVILRGQDIPQENSGR